MQRLRKGDEIVVISGREKGKRGRVLRANPEKGQVFVEKLNLVKRHQKPNQKYPQGGIIEKEAPIHVSNVMLSDPKDGKPTRIRAKVNADGIKSRAAVRSGDQIGAPVSATKEA